MSAELHPKLKEALSQPGDPNATPVEQQDPEDARAEFETDIAAVDGPAPEMAEVRERRVAAEGREIETRCYLPRGLSDAAPTMVYLHGGGNIRGSLKTHDSTCRVLAEAGKCAIVSVEYRLAPEHPYPAAVEDAVAVVQEVARDDAPFGGKGGPLIVGGDSAGGNLAAVVAQVARDRGGPEIAAQMLIYPVVDFLADTESRRLYSKGYMLDSMPFYTKSYIPDEAARGEAYASPNRAKSLQGLPPALVLTAGFDPLCDEGKAYGKALEDAGVKVEYLHYPEMIHGFTLLRGLLAEADEALGACIKATLGLIGR